MTMMMEMKMKMKMMMMMMMMMMMIPRREVKSSIPREVIKYHQQSHN